MSASRRNRFDRGWSVVVPVVWAADRRIHGVLRNSARLPMSLRSRWTIDPCRRPIGLLASLQGACLDPAIPRRPARPPTFPGPSRLPCPPSGLLPQPAPGLPPCRCRHSAGGTSARRNGSLSPRTAASSPLSRPATRIASPCALYPPRAHAHVREEVYRYGNPCFPSDPHGRTPPVRSRRRPLSPNAPHPAAPPFRPPDGSPPPGPVNEWRPAVKAGQRVGPGVPAGRSRRCM